MQGGNLWKAGLTRGMGTLLLLTGPAAGLNAAEPASRWSQEIGHYLIDPDVSSSAISGPGLPPGTAVDVDDGGSYLLTTTYHYSDALSFEFFYSGWNELDVQADGSIAALGDVGSIEYLAPTLMANWTFGDERWLVRPYLGIGVNRMIYGDEQANDVLEGALGGPTRVKLEDTWGAAFTAGLTGRLGERVYATAAYVQIGTDTSATIVTDAVNTRRVVDLDTDLNIWYLNVGFRF